MCARALCIGSAETETNPSKGRSIFQDQEDRGGQGQRAHEQRGYDGSVVRGK